MNEEKIKKEFEKVWEEINKLKEKRENNPKVKIKQESTNNKLENEIKIFCKNNDLDEKKLKYEIDFQEDFPRLINLPREKKRTKLQFNVLVFLTPIYHRIYCKNMSQAFVRNLFELNRVPLERMDKLYESPNFKKFFSKSGTNIKISWAGEQEGIKKLRELIENGKTRSS